MVEKLKKRFYYLIKENYLKSETVKRININKWSWSKKTNSWVTLLYDIIDMDVQVNQ